MRKRCRGVFLFHIFLSDHTCQNSKQLDLTDNKTDNDIGYPQKSSHISKNDQKRVANMQQFYQNRAGQRQQLAIQHKQLKGIFPNLSKE